MLAMTGGTRVLASRLIVLADMGNEPDEVLVDLAAPHGLAQTARHVHLGRNQDHARVGGEPGEGQPGTRPGEDAAGIGGEQQLGPVVGADRHQSVIVRATGVREDTRCPRDR